MLSFWLPWSFLSHSCWTASAKTNSHPLAKGNVQCLRLR